MSAPGVALQGALRAILLADPAVSAILGGRIWDDVPEAPVFPYATFGPEDASEDDAEGITALALTLQLDLWLRAGGSLAGTKAAVQAVRRALHGAAADLGEHALVELRVTLTRAFRDPDGLTGHGVVQVTALIDEGAG